MEALDDEPGALMICSVTVRWSEGGSRERRSCGAESSVAPTQSFLIGVCEPCGGVAATAGLVRLCRHEILMVEEAKEGGGEEAGSDPPSKEGEEAPEKQGAEDSPQTSKSHRQLGY